MSTGELNRYKLDQLIQQANPELQISAGETEFTKEPPSIVYDADGIQEIPFTIKHRGQIFQVTFTLDPAPDEVLLEYDRMIDARLHQVSFDESKTKNGVVPITKNTLAAVWLFDKLAQRVDGIGRPGEDMPANWKNVKPMTAELKEAVITRAFLLVEGQELPVATPDQFIEWGEESELSDIRLRALYSGHQVILTHSFASASDSERENYNSIKKRAIIATGAKVGQADTVIPATWKPIGAIYDRLNRGNTGYRGRVPIHHKVAAADQYLRAENDAVAKN